MGAVVDFALGVGLGWLTGALGFMAWRATRHAWEPPVELRDSDTEESGW